MQSAGNGDGQAGKNGDGVLGAGPSYHSKNRSYSAERLMLRAIRGGWKIPSKLKGEAIATLSKMISDPDLAARSKIAAIKALGALSKAELDALRTVSFLQRGGPDPCVERAQQTSITLQQFLQDTHRLAELEEDGDAV
jgi:hypothetical protein